MLSDRDFHWDLVTAPNRNESSFEFMVRPFVGQEAKLAALAEKAPRSVTVINYTSRIGEVGGAAGKALGPAGMVVGVVGAATAIKDNPNMSGLEFMYRAAGLYDVGVQLGLIPRPPQEF